MMTTAFKHATIYPLTRGMRGPNSCKKKRIFDAILIAIEKGIYHHIIDNGYGTRSTLTSLQNLFRTNQ
jgi:hypothetical protein